MTAQATGQPGASPGSQQPGQGGQGPAPQAVPAMDAGPAADAQLERTWKEQAYRRSVEDKTVVAVVTLYLAAAAGATQFQPVEDTKQALLVCTLLVTVLAAYFLIINGLRLGENASVINQLGKLRALLSIPGVTYPDSWLHWNQRGEGKWYWRMWKVGWGTWSRILAIITVGLATGMVVWNKPRSPAAYPHDLARGSRYVVAYNDAGVTAAIVTCHSGAVDVYDSAQSQKPVFRILKGQVCSIATKIIQLESTEPDTRVTIERK